MQRSQYAQKQVSEKSYFVPLRNKNGEPFKFDWDRVVIEEPHMNKSKNNPHTWCTADIYYLDENGNKLQIFFQLARQTIFGFNGSWDPKIEKKNRSLDNMKDITVGYPLTTKDTIKNPTPDEATSRERLYKSFEIVRDTFIKWCDENQEDDTKHPLCSIVSGSYLRAKAKYDKSKNLTDWELFVKRPFSHPKKKDNEGKTVLDKKTNKPVIDDEKPERAYLKLACRGEGEKMMIQTKVKGPNRSPIDPRDYITTDENLHIAETDVVVHLSNVYLGAHASEPHNVSVKYVISEMNYIPQSGGSAYGEEFLPNMDEEPGYDNYDNPLGNKTEQPKSELKTEKISEAKDDQKPDEKSSKAIKESAEEKKAQMIAARTHKKSPNTNVNNKQT